MQRPHQRDALTLALSRRERGLPLTFSQRKRGLRSISTPFHRRTSRAFSILADERRMLLETARGCRFRCKYCYYPKSHRQLRFLSADQILANLDYAAEHGATELVLLDPTLNQRPDFADFLRLLRRGNPAGRLAFSGELRAEGIDAVVGPAAARGRFP